tara:strand:- start:2415 stop:2609 length:195 start_codon:yes stop_codon:yes gene_type:complete
MKFTAEQIAYLERVIEMEDLRITCVDADIFGNIHGNIYGYVKGGVEVGVLDRFLFGFKNTEGTI